MVFGEETEEVQVSEDVPADSAYLKKLEEKYMAENYEKTRKRRQKEIVSGDVKKEKIEKIEGTQQQNGNNSRDREIGD